MIASIFANTMVAFWAGVILGAAFGIVVLALVKENRK